MGRIKKKNNLVKIPNNREFLESAELNSLTYIDFLERFQRIALSMFEWVNLPNSMDSRYLERCLYFYGQASLLLDPKYGYINTKCSSNNKVNIYGLPTELKCYSYEYNTSRLLYTGLKSEEAKKKECILVMNNWNKTPTVQSMRLFAQRLYEAERSSDVNIRAQKYPLILITPENKRLSMENIYSQLDGNKPAIMVNKENYEPNSIQAIKTDSPFVADKLQEYKMRIWNEALTYLGINNIALEKKERLVTGETSENNEVINMNLWSMLAPRKEGCKKFNELFDENIDVRVRSDLYNVIKTEMSSVSDLIPSDIKEKEGESNE